MSRTTLTRWGVATLGFVLIALAEIRFGRAVALGTLLALMLIVAIYGGSGYGDGGVPSRRGAAPDSEEDRARASDRSEAPGVPMDPNAAEDHPNGPAGSNPAGSPDRDVGEGR